VGGQLLGSKRLAAVERTGMLEMVRRVRGSPQHLVKSQGNGGGGGLTTKGACQISLQGMLWPMLQKVINFEKSPSPENCIGSSL